MTSLFHKLEERKEQQERQKQQTLPPPTPQERAPESLAKFAQPDADISIAGPLPVPRDLLQQLTREYPRLKNLVDAYLTVQDQINRYDEIRADLERADEKEGESLTRDFWTRLHPRLGSDGLGADPSLRELREDPEVQKLVSTFDNGLGSARVAAMRGRKIRQSPDVVEEAYAAVTQMLDAAVDLASHCKSEARILLRELHDTVSLIFDIEKRRAGAQDAPSGHSTSDASIAHSPSGEVSAAGAVETATEHSTINASIPQKQLGSRAREPDVEGHLFPRSKGAP